jgi:cytochrome c oxidase cbb3-type subunit 2
VPLAVLAALIVIWGGLRWRRGRTARAGALGATALLAALGCVPVVLSIVLSSGPAAGAGAGAASSTSARDREAAVARGRQVYIAEGCIHCHSEYVRPGTRDEILWGPHRQHGAEGTPPLIGVRRQGPDLTNVGVRHTAAWERLHLIDPRSLVPGSRMPSYAALFDGDGGGDGHGSRGADLVAYLQSLGRDDAAGRRAVVARTPVPERAGSKAAGRVLFAGYCAPCHGSAGHGDGPLARAVRGADPEGDMARTMDLTKGTFWAVSWSPKSEPLEADLARTIRFGIPGTPMPGHEMLTDGEVRDLVAYVEALARSGHDRVATRLR